MGEHLRAGRYCVVSSPSSHLYSQNQFSERPARRVGQKAVDWISLGSRIPAAAKGEFAAFRSRHESIKSSLQSLPEKPAPVNWDYYTANVANQALVARFQEAYAAVSVPVPVDTESEAIAAQEQEIEAEVLAAIENSKAKVAELEGELATIKAMKPFEEMTIEEYLADKPELKKEIDDEIAAHNWSH